VRSIVVVRVNACVIGRVAQLVILVDHVVRLRFLIGRVRRVFVFSAGLLSRLGRQWQSNGERSALTRL
jgi:hypothetical protein